MKWLALGKVVFFIQFLFTRLYLSFIVTVYLPGSQRHKYLVNGFRSPYCIPNSEQTEIANDLFFAKENSSFSQWPFWLSSVQALAVILVIRRLVQSLTFV